MNPVVHFELPYEEAERAKKFYQSVFGWKTQELGPKMNNYILVTTADSTVKAGAPEGAINGGLFVKHPENSHPTIVIGVGNIDNSMEKVIAHGGIVLGKPHEIPNIGMYVGFRDTEGNQLSMIQPYMPNN